MFLFFLSKLLPLLIYPLGLIFILMLVAFVLLWKFPKMAAKVLGMALVVLLVSSNGWVSNWLVRSLEGRHIPEVNLPRVDAIVVLGGGIKEKKLPRPMPDFAEGGDRIIYGAQLYFRDRAPIMILSGGRIDWEKRTGVPESKDMAEIAEFLGVPRVAIIQETKSLNTHENAVNVQKIMKNRRIERVLLVTSAMHMPRAIGAFRHQAIDAIPAPTDFLTTKTLGTEPKFIPEEMILNMIPEVTRIEKTTKALKEYVGMVYYRLRGWL